MWVRAAALAEEAGYEKLCFVSANELPLALQPSSATK